MNISKVGEGKVELLAGGGKIFTDVAARFTRTERSLDEIIGSPYNKEIVKNIIESGHKAALEFDYFIFGIEGYSRVTEVQLVRKRHANYMIKSGRNDKKGKRSFDMVVPEDILSHKTNQMIDASRIILPDGENSRLSTKHGYAKVCIETDLDMLLRLTEGWYDTGVEAGYKEEELRYGKQQATEFKAIVGMNASGLLDFFKIRTCCNAQTEINDLATKMMYKCKGAAPDLFVNAGPSCVSLGYCPENSLQNEKCKGKVIPQKLAMEILKRANEDI